MTQIKKYKKNCNSQNTAVQQVKRATGLEREDMRTGSVTVNFRYRLVRDVAVPVWGRAHRAVTLGGAPRRHADNVMGDRKPPREGPRRQVYPLFLKLYVAAR